VEIQIIADAYGHVVSLGERDCSIQRRHQKLLEESPSPVVDAKLRKRMGEVAVRGAKAVNYTSLGTIECLVDAQGNFYFIEMNTRVQVEHPVTEMVTGIDLVKEQIRIAAGERLPFTQEDVRWTGHAIECRINAEDPDQDFMPCPGLVTIYHPPGGPHVRVDSHLYAGYRIPPYYDSLLAKVIVYGRNRREAIQTMSRALEEMVIEPIKTTIPFHRKVLNDPDFLAGKYATDFVERLYGTQKTAGELVGS